MIHFGVGGRGFPCHARKWGEGWEGYFCAVHAWIHSFSIVLVCCSLADTGEKLALYTLGVP